MKRTESSLSASAALLALGFTLFCAASASAAAAAQPRGDGDTGAPATTQPVRKRNGTEKQAENVQRYMARIFDPKKYEHACNATNPAEFKAWQTSARAALNELLRIPTIRADAGGFQPRAVMQPAIDDLGAFTRQEGRLETEPDVAIHFWILQPKGKGPFPVALVSNGHGPSRGAAGIYASEESKQHTLAEDRDVGVQAATRGFIAIVPSTRGIGQDPEAFALLDLDGRNGGKDCVAHNWHAIAAGRTMMGERVWDIMKFIDWALALPESDRKTVFMTGNSGGGMLTTYAAAIDERISIASPSSSFDDFFAPAGNLTHCQCNHFPGMVRFGQFWDFAGLIAPRPLLTVTGIKDPAHPVAEIRHAAGEMKRIYTAAGVPDHYEHAFGPAGHRFYKDLMWEFVSKTLGRDLR
ncbi:MAG: hypothetical protein ABIQ12_14735 [Opitutaceae bacterium]